MLRVLHVTEDHSIRNTGITGTLDKLLRRLPTEISCALLCTAPDPVAPPDGVRLYSLLPGRVGRPWHWALGQRRALSCAISESDVVHLHGLWMWVQWAAAQEAVRSARPFLVTPFGMLEPWLWSGQSPANQLKKQVYWRIFASPAFRAAGAIHALTAHEADGLTSFFPGQRIEILPFGIDLAEADQALNTLAENGAPDQPYFLYMGRLHPKKGIDLLLQAFARLPERGFRLKIAGPVQPGCEGYAARLQALASQPDLAGRVDFTGPVYGAEKWRLLRQAWAFCLPSYSEAIALVNLEAGAAGTPVITTYETGVVADWERQGGLLVHPETGALLSALSQATCWTGSERQGRGAALRRLIETHYNWSVLAPQWAGLYRTLA